MFVSACKTKDARRRGSSLSLETVELIATCFTVVCFWVRSGFEGSSSYASVSARQATGVTQGRSTFYGDGRRRTSSNLRATMVLERGEGMRSIHSRKALLRKRRGSSISGKAANNLPRVGER